MLATDAEEPCCTVNFMFAHPCGHVPKRCEKPCHAQLMLHVLKRQKFKSIPMVATLIVQGCGDKMFHRCDHERTSSLLHARGTWNCWPTWSLSKACVRPKTMHSEFWLGLMQVARGQVAVEPLQSICEG